MNQNHLDRPNVDPLCAYCENQLECPEKKRKKFEETGDCEDYR